MTLDQDFDDEGQVYAVTVVCEGCAGSGSLCNCRRCDAVMPQSTAEMVGYLCAECVDRGQRSDQADEMSRRRRVG